MSKINTFANYKLKLISFEENKNVAVLQLLSGDNIISSSGRPNCCQACTRINFFRNETGRFH